MRYFHLALIFTLSAAANVGLYQPMGGPIQLSTYNTATGKQTTIGGSVSGVGGNDAAALDAVNQIIYIFDNVSTGWTVIGMSLNTGAIVKSWPINQFSVPKGYDPSLAMAFDSSSGNLIISGYQGSNGPMVVVSLNTATGAMTTIGTFNLPGCVGGCATIDNLGNYWVSAVLGSEGEQNYLWKVNMATGQAMQINTTFATGMPNTVTFNPSDGLIWGYGMTINKLNEYAACLYNLNPSTGAIKVTAIMPINFFYNLECEAGLDTTNGILYSLFYADTWNGANLVGMSLSTGQIVTMPNVTFANPLSQQYGISMVFLNS